MGLETGDGGRGTGRRTFWQLACAASPDVSAPRKEKKREASFKATPICSLAVSGALLFYSQESFDGPRRLPYGRALSSHQHAYFGVSVWFFPPPHPPYGMFVNLLCDCLSVYCAGLKLYTCSRGKYGGRKACAGMDVNSEKKRRKKESTRTGAA